MREDDSPGDQAYAAALYYNQLFLQLIDDLISGNIRTPFCIGIPRRSEKYEHTDTAGEWGRILRQSIKQRA